MLFMGGPVRDDQSFIAINATNVGNRATTILTVGMYQYDNWWKRLRRRSTKAWVVNTAPPGNVPPHVVEPGHRFLTFAIQSEEFVKLSKEKLMYVAIGDSMAKREVLVRLRPIVVKKLNDEG